MHSAASFCQFNGLEKCPVIGFYHLDEMSGNDEIYDKPRRLDDDTANYLLQLQSQVADCPSSEAEVLIDNILQEIASTTARLAKYINMSYYVHIISD